MQATSRSWRDAWTDSPSEATGRNQPCPHLDFGLTASWMVRGYISVVVSHHACAYLSDSSEKQIQGLWGRKEAEDRPLGSEGWPGEGPGSASTRLEPLGSLESLPLPASASLEDKGPCFQRRKWAGPVATLLCTPTLSSDALFRMPPKRLSRWPRA